MAKVASMAGGQGRGSEYPEGLSAAHADSRTAPPLVIRLLPLLLLGAFIAASFTGIYGGTPNATSSAAGERAVLTANVPRVLRSGEFFEMRFRIRAIAPLADATLAVDRAYLHDLTVNTLLPAAESERASDGVFRFSYGPLDAGEVLDIKLDGQVNPSLFLGTAGAVAIADGEDQIARLPLELTVLP
jgi:hypothetical protein